MESCHDKVYSFHILKFILSTDGEVSTRRLEKIQKASKKRPGNVGEGLKQRAKRWGLR